MVPCNKLPGWADTFQKRSSSGPVQNQNRRPAAVMSNSDRVVLVLGGAGTVGSGIVKALLDTGNLIIIIIIIKHSFVACISESFHVFSAFLRFSSLNSFFVIC